jgi:fumarate hydratase subunit beta
MTEYRITVPIKDEDIKKLNIRDIVYVAGTVYVARDRTHERLMEYARKGEKSPINLGGAVIYHAGPIVRKKNGEWKVIVAGPTTSTRMNKITSQILEKYPIRMIIGKGGMNSEVAEAMKKYIAIYCHYTGGAAVLATKNIKKVMSVEWLDLGMPEAL